MMSSGLFEKAGLLDAITEWENSISAFGVFGQLINEVHG